jgi:hypothetical protein
LFWVDCNMKPKSEQPLFEIPFEDAVTDAADSVKMVHLRLLMKEREDAFLRIVDLDYAIWILEEYFRTGAP